MTRFLTAAAAAALFTAPAFAQAVSPGGSAPGQSVIDQQREDLSRPDDQTAAVPGEEDLTTDSPVPQEEAIEEGMPPIEDDQTAEVPGEEPDLGQPGGEGQSGQDPATVGEDTDLPEGGGQRQDQWQPDAPSEMERRPR